MSKVRETSKARALVRAVIEREDGSVEELVTHNLITTVGREWRARRIAGDSAEPIGLIAAGTDDTEEALGDASLGDELDRVGIQEFERDGNEVNFEAVFEEGVATGSWRELGVLSDDPENDLISRVTFDVINKGSSDVVRVVWTYIFE